MGFFDKLFKKKEEKIEEIQKEIETNLNENIEKIKDILSSIKNIEKVILKK